MALPRPVAPATRRRTRTDPSSITYSRQVRAVGAMAPPRPVARATRRRTRAAVLAALPPDMLYEVLLRLPTDAACRFRAVCRSWRALLSGEPFVTAHAARQGLLLLGGEPYVSRPSTWHLDLVSLAGDIVRRTRLGFEVAELLTCGDLALACIVGVDGRARAMDPVTGAVTELPHDLSDQNSAWVQQFEVLAHAFGPAAAAATGGEHNLLRVLNVWWDDGWDQVAEVLTHGGHGEGGAARWRGVQSPPFYLAGSSSFGNGDGEDFVAPPSSIAPFDLETDEWMPVLHGPLLNQMTLQEDVDPNIPSAPLLNLAELDGSLVAVHSARSQPSPTDLWFLTDAKDETWVKKYSIQIELLPRRREFYTQPLLVLDGGRKIVRSVLPRRGLVVYDLKRGTCTDLGRRKYAAYGVYKGCAQGAENTA